MFKRQREEIDIWFDTRLSIRASWRPWSINIKVEQNAGNGNVLHRNILNNVHGTSKSVTMKTTRHFSEWLSMQYLRITTLWKANKIIKKCNLLCSFRQNTKKSRFLKDISCRQLTRQISILTYYLTRVLTRSWQYIGWNIIFWFRL